MPEIYEAVGRVGADSPAVLITGEYGAGKHFLARRIHAHSPQASRPMVVVSCGSDSESVLEWRLFCGCHPDRDNHRAAAAPVSAAGAVYLDEVGEASPRMQALLLRFLENGAGEPFGPEHGRAREDVLVIAATARNLGHEVIARRFRSDLLRRLQTTHLHVPPLRERREEIAPLVDHFLAQAGRRLRLDPDVIGAMAGYRWPGNVRELQSVVERLAWSSQGESVSLDDLPPHISARGSGTVPRRERRRQQADELFDAITGGTVGFWEDVHPRFLDRDLTREDLRELVRRGLTATKGNYRRLVRLFRMPGGDYKRLLNFLGTHDCMVDFREFRRAARDRPGTAQGRAAGPS